jgi:hypothetical protein
MSWKLKGHRKRKLREKMTDDERAVTAGLVERWLDDQGYFAKFASIGLDRQRAIDSVVELIEARYLVIKLEWLDDDHFVYSIEPKDLAPGEPFVFPEAGRS